MTERAPIQSITESVAHLERLTYIELGRLVREYLRATVDDTDFEGYTVEDRKAIQSFLSDMCLFHKHMA